MQRIAFFVPGLPKAQARPRAFARGGHARVYNAKNAEGWKGSIALAVKEHLPAAPHLGPVVVDLTFFFPRPQAHFGTGRNANKLKDWAPLYHCKKPDRDNLDKPVLDALKDLGMFKDDGQVFNGVLRKYYVTENPPIKLDGFEQNRPGMFIIITLLEAATNRV